MNKLKGKRSVGGGKKKKKKERKSKKCREKYRGEIKKYVLNAI